MSGTALLRAESFGRRFGDRRVLIAASLYVYAGKVAVVFGGNGSGKSTLFRAITGQVRADHGVLHYGGQVYERPQLHELARNGLFYIPERGIVSPLLTLRQQLEFFNPEGEARERTRVVIDQLALTGLSEHYGSELSPGERIRASFAFALLRQPRCLLADEPFMGVAPLDGERIAAAISQLKANGAAIAITGHETSTLFDLADEVIWLTSGTTHTLGSSEQALRHSQFRREYLALK